MDASIVTKSLRIKHEHALNFWAGKLGKQGDGYVGRIGENHEMQQQRIEDLLRTRLDANQYFNCALDYGCGWGRFSEFFSDFCGHIWAADILNELVERAAARAPNITPFLVSYPLSFPLRLPKFELLWASLVFQHITDDVMLDATLAEIGRVLKPGARVLILDNARDRAHHVNSREPGRFARALNLKPGWTSELVTINKRPRDHWLLDGVKG